MTFFAPYFWIEKWWIMILIFCTFTNNNVNGYTIHGNPRYNWANADASCRRKGYPGLAVIHSEAEYREVKALCANYVHPSHCWIGLRYWNKGTICKWTDNSNFDYGKTLWKYPWVSGKPNGSGRTFDCIFLRKDRSYNWENGPCNGSPQFWHLPYICDTGPPTPSPTSKPTQPPTKVTSNPTKNPTTPPTPAPTSYPTSNPTNDPTAVPSKYPTSDPTDDPTADPTADPTNDPTSDPTIDPTNDPSSDPTRDPTTEPTADPTADPTSDPTQDPTGDPTAEPTIEPTTEPTVEPTTEPTLEPTIQPTLNPTLFPSAIPSVSPSESASSVSSEMLMKIVEHVLLEFGVSSLVVNSQIAQSGNDDVTIDQTFSFKTSSALSESDKNAIKFRLEAKYSQLIDSFDSSMFFVRFEDVTRQRRLLQSARYLVTVHYGDNHEGIGDDQSTNDSSGSETLESSSDLDDDRLLISIISIACLVSACLVIACWMRKRQKMEAENEEQNIVEAVIMGSDMTDLQPGDDLPNNTDTLRHTKGAQLSGKSVDVLPNTTKTNVIHVQTESAQAFDDIMAEMAMSDSEEPEIILSEDV